MLEQDSLWGGLVEIKCVVVFKILGVKVCVEGALRGYMVCFCEILLLKGVKGQLCKCTLYYL